MPLTDICDTLAGRYPKDFKFTGWHPLCRCRAVTILKTDEEIAEDTSRILNGQKPTKKSVNTVRDVPAAFKDWIEDNAGRITRAKSLPCFLRDNGTMEGGKYELKKFGAVGTAPAPRKSPLEIAKERHAARTPKQIQTIKDAWEARRLQNSQLTSIVLKIKDPDNITDEEIMNVIKDFADKNPNLFLGGLKDVEIHRASYFMANGRCYENGIYDMKGNTIMISCRDMLLNSNLNIRKYDIEYNPLDELRGAFRTICKRETLTFNQEYTLESLWHEIRHAGAVGGWQLTELGTQSMEVINQFCARHSYGGFVKALGGKAVHTAEVIEKGYGYGQCISNFQSLLKQMNVTQAEAHAHFKDMIIKTKYKDIHGEIVKFVQKKGGYDWKTANDIVEKLDKKPMDYIEELNKINR